MLGSKLQRAHGCANILLFFRCCTVMKYGVMDLRHILFISTYSGEACPGFSFVELFEGHGDGFEEEPSARSEAVNGALAKDLNARFQQSGYAKPGRSFFVSPEFGYLRGGGTKYVSRHGKEALFDRVRLVDAAGSTDPASAVINMHGCPGKHAPQGGR